MFGANHSNVKKMRESGIELLKLIAILDIMLGHCIQTLSSENPYVAGSEYIMDLSAATNNMQNLFLSFFRIFLPGVLIFFICVSWFLLESNSTDFKRIFYMISEIWFISVAILIVMLVVRTGDIQPGLILSSLFPSTFATNWYMTCYILIYLLHPILNGLIYGMDKKRHFRCVAILSGLYIFINYFKNIIGKSGFFFTNWLVTWITVYFIVAYMKIYLMEFCNSTKANLRLFMFGAGGHVFLFILTDIIGLYTPMMKNKLLIWNVECSPFYIMACIAMFNLFRRFKFQSKGINYVSSLTLIMYITHENILIRNYIRPYIFKYIYEQFGYDFIVLWVLIITVLTFIISFILGAFYDIFLKQSVKRISDMVFECIKKKYLKLEARIIKLK
ncbi:MAG: acyltransferase [Lachnospiraceae bacterium]|nr:acyltransferase [Lachnospiraceae bacterium]